MSEAKPSQSKEMRLLARAKRNRLIAFFVVGVGLLFLFAAATAALFVNRANNRADELVTRTITVLIEVRSYQAGVQGAVIGERAYLLTGEERFLTDYENALAAYRESQERVQELARDSPPQQLRLDRLDAIADEITAILRRAITNLQPEEIIDYVRNNNADPLLAEFNEQIEAFINEERRRLREQRLKQLQSGRLGDQIILLTLLVITGLLFFQVYITQEQAKLQMTRNVGLEARVAERTRELEQATHALKEENLRVESLLRDLHHRVGNSLQLVASFLGLQASQVEGEEAKTTLRAARERVLAIAATQKRLRFSSDHETVDAENFIDMIVGDLKAHLTFEQDIEIETDIQNAIVPSRDAVTIGVLLAELVTNAVKYAFQGHKSGRIRVSFRKDEETGLFHLDVEDDGVGIEAGAADPHGGLGMRIIGQLVAALGGEFRSASVRSGERPGARVSVAFPTSDWADKTLSRSTEPGI